MTILTRPVILEHIRSGRIVVEPFAEDRVGPASIDLLLGNRFRVFKNAAEPIELREGFDIGLVTVETSIADGSYLQLDPGQGCLGVTLERIVLPGDICGWLQGRSRYARAGLITNTIAGFVHPGVNNHQVLEIFNIGCLPLRIFPGIALCQLILQECVGEAFYTGHFDGQQSP